MTDPVLGVISPVRLEYTFGAGRAQSRFLRGLLERRFIGQRCGKWILQSQGNPRDHPVSIRKGEPLTGKTIDYVGREYYGLGDRRHLR